MPSALRTVQPTENDDLAGSPEVYATDILCDDFALDVDGNLYATGGPANALFVVSPQGAVKALLTSEDGMRGPTAAIFDEVPDMPSRRFVVTTGNFFASQRSPEQRESDEVFPSEVIAIDFGTPGASVPGQ